MGARMTARGVSPRRIRMLSEVAFADLVRVWQESALGEDVAAGLRADAHAD
jgi:hypothetical protein